MAKLAVTPMSFSDRRKCPSGFERNGCGLWTVVHSSWRHESSVDDLDEAYQTLDVAEYFGGKNVAGARALVLSQLKYSTLAPDKAWTENHSRHRQPDDRL